MEQKVIYNGQILTLTRFWATGEPCLWITDPEQGKNLAVENNFLFHPHSSCIFFSSFTIRSRFFAVFMKVGRWSA